MGAAPGSICFTMSAQPEERQYGQDDDDQSNQINQTVHFSLLVLLTIELAVHHALCDARFPAASRRSSSLKMPGQLGPNLYLAMREPTRHGSAPRNPIMETYWEGSNREQHKTLSRSDALEQILGALQR
ncbi:hypothetical protein [Bradyrhizobium sp. AUGA SZCCT0160]|uniref:hypothetical protein n=1 Tax=Bradyrhizobium sp. AUGA SZCCT0160 TaxID=2807662 RepID=UPI001BAA9A5A|nr:hypothetical protein [Bradyrhizobium sp. AUGA SZCCT0160]MBR1191078.1 hypothetical protein [Bradyrhizobium sp. AUGA SZCCT0160]